MKFDGHYSQDCRQIAILSEEVEPIFCDFQPTMVGRRFQVNQSADFNQLVFAQITDIRVRVGVFLRPVLCCVLGIHISKLLEHLQLKSPIQFHKSSPGVEKGGVGTPDSTSGGNAQQAEVA